MGKASPKLPPAPNLGQVSATQSKINKETLLESMRLSQMNEKTPFGQMRYEGPVGSQTRITELSPELQRQMNQQNQLSEMMGNQALNRLAHLNQAPLDLSDLPTVPKDLTAQAQQVEKATFDQAMTYLKPQIEDEKRQLEIKLGQRGIPMESKAYQKATTQLDQSQKEALKVLALSSIAAGRAEQSRLVNQAQALRQQAYQEKLAQRAQPMNELAALMQGAPAMPMPNFAPQQQYQMAPVDYTGMTQQQYMTAVQDAHKRAQAQNSQFAGLGKLFGAFL